MILIINLSTKFSTPHTVHGPKKNMLFFSGKYALLLIKISASFSEKMLIF
jgi:hypothetical protein